MGRKVESDNDDYLPSSVESEEDDEVDDLPTYKKSDN